ncbi:family 78 glycoside hydrolase catalytic domain [Microbacterium invictum]|nr:family 78 glycoside hydrolase catalytic domain [Microbacterium invictum]
MISPDVERDTAPLLRRVFALDSGHGEVTSAELLATALGVCEVTINGKPASPDLLTPGWSSYEWRLRYAQWNVTDLLEQENVIGILVGNGWHTGHLGFAGGKALYGPERAALAELHITFDDGHVQIIATDQSWASGPSDVLADDLYNGESIDARRRDLTWTSPGTLPSGWSGTRAIPFDRSRLTPYVGPPVRRQEERAPVSIWTSPTGATLADFGQNLVGWIRLSLRGRAGDTITIRHAEVLEDNELGVRPLRTARATDEYTLSGELDVFEPTFTFHGFRYAEVTGWTGTLDELSAALTAVVIGSQLDRIGTFACSDPLLNQLHSNVVWSMRGNFVDVPTDCPQRDERLGWTGDLSAFVDTASFLYDVESFLSDWLLDLSAEQSHANGDVALVVPDVLKIQMKDLGSEAPALAPVMALWSDAACWVPWSLWEAYGDITILEQQYDSMAAYVRRVSAVLSDRDLLEAGLQLADWLDPTAPPDAPFEAKADPKVVATACVYRSATIAAKTSVLLQRDDDAAEFLELAARLRTAFNAHFVDGGRVLSDAPAVYALAIAFDLLDEDADRVAGERLAELVAESGYTITTGFAGTPFISGALTKTGHLDAAYRLLLQTENPSWLYPVTMGATTIWERWDSMLPDGTINPGEMTSFNHYAFGSIATWMHRTVAGLAPLEPGYSRILIAPQPGGGLTWASAALETPHGRTSVRWEINGDSLTVEAEVPKGSSAVVRLPNSDELHVGGGMHVFHS